VQNVIKAGSGRTLIPLGDSIFLWPSVLATLVVFVVAVAWLPGCGPVRRA
jgi:hypothetical protein